MNITYFSRRLIFSSGGGEQCDWYLIELIKTKGYKINLVYEKNRNLIFQERKRNLFNKIKEELYELYFYFKNRKFFINSDLLIFTGRSLSVGIICSIVGKKSIHNIHGETNKIALWLLRKSNTLIFFWGNSFEMSGKPRLKRSINNLIPSSKTIRKLILERENKYKKIISIKDCNKIIWVGRLEPIKEPMLCIKTIEYYYELNKNFTLDLIGDGSLKNIIDNYYSNMPRDIAAKISIRGEIENENIESYYQSSNVLLITSITENFPLVMIEALINKTTIISVPITTLERSPFSEFINFTNSRNPKDIAECINSKTFKKTDRRKINDVREDIIKKYNIQKNIILKWFE